MTIPRMLLFAMLFTTAGFFVDASRRGWKGKHSISLPLSLISISVLIAHDAYGNRLLPPPNGIAQIMGYLEALWCLGLGAVLLWRYRSS